MRIRGGKVLSVDLLQRFQPVESGIVMSIITALGGEATTFVTGLRAIASDEAVVAVLLEDFLKCEENLLVVVDDQNSAPGRFHDSFCYDSLQCTGYESNVDPSLVL